MVPLRGQLASASRGRYAPSVIPTPGPSEWGTWIASFRGPVAAVGCTFNMNINQEGTNLPCLPMVCLPARM